MLHRATTAALTVAVTPLWVASAAGWAACTAALSALPPRSTPR